MKGAEAPVIYYFIAEGLEASGWRRLHEVIALADDPAFLEDIRAEVRPLSPRVEWLAGMARAEYQFAVQRIDTHGRKSVPDFVGRLLFQPNRTKAKLAAQCRATIERLRGGDFAGIEPISGLLPSWIDASSVSRGITAQGIRTCALRERAHHRLTRALIALRLYRLEKGELPANLEDLVPRHLESVPVDPYDGQPIRYSREHRRVYCARDIADREWLAQEDLGVAIEF